MCPELYYLHILAITVAKLVEETAAAGPHVAAVRVHHSVADAGCDRAHGDATELDNPLQCCLAFSVSTMAQLPKLVVATGPELAHLCS